SDVKDTVKRLGLNLGAPGNRKAPDGTLWLEYPYVGGPSQRVAVETTPAKLDCFRRHASQITGELPWVGASGVRGLTSLTVPLVTDNKPRRYTVRLHFAEPDDLAIGDRVFSVALQGRAVLPNLDVLKDAGGVRHVLVKEFKGVEVRKELKLTLQPARGC